MLQARPVLLETFAVGPLGCNCSIVVDPAKSLPAADNAPTISMAIVSDDARVLITPKPNHVRLLEQLKRFMPEILQQRRSHHSPATAYGVRNAHSARLNASGCCRFARCAAPGMTVSVASGISRAITSDSGIGVTSS